jgi:hypothetical protein
MASDHEPQTQPTSRPVPDEARPDIEADQADGVGGPDIRIDEDAGVGAPDIRPER